MIDAECIRATGGGVRRLHPSSLPGARRCGRPGLGWRDTLLTSVALLGPATMLLGPGGLAAQGTVQLDPRVQELVGQVSEENLEHLIYTLADFETRHTFSSVDDPDRGIGAAREWMVEELRGYSPRLHVGLDCYDVVAAGRVTRDVELCNVKAVLRGRTARRIYVSGHYDTVARVLEEAEGEWAGYDRLAPGANDDGSGTAVAMELARILSQSGLEFDATLVFVGFAGEELGLVGARLHAQRALDEGIRIDAVFNNDIVGNIHAGDGQINGTAVQVFAPGPDDSPARTLARYAYRYGTAYMPHHEIRLVGREDRFGRGGDHTPFNYWGFAAIRFTEVMENYARQHSVEDTADGVYIPYLARNARVNVAGVASLALAPSAPDVNNPNGNPRLTRGPTGYGALLQWEASPGATSYRVFIRDGWSMDWQQVYDVGDVTDFHFPGLSIDEHYFGVAAVGPAGHESLVSPYVRPPRVIEEVETR
jgi:hypothetical protein